MLTPLRANGRPSGRYLPASFALIALLFVVIDAAASQRAQLARNDMALVLDNALVSEELVSRMRHDVDRERLLVDAHIFEKRSNAMAVLERQIGETQEDFHAAADAYAPLTTFPGEAETWLRVVTGLGGLQQPLAAALALSRENRDVDAQRHLGAVEDRFAAVDNDLTRLVRINHDAAKAAQAHIEGVQHSLRRLRAALALLGVAVTAIVGVFVTRMTRDWEERERRQALDLEERNRDLDAFAGRVAHDLRGPLTTFRLGCERLPASTPQEERTRTLLHRSVDRMDAFISDLLALSRIDAQVVNATCDPAEVVRQLCVDLEPRVAAEGGTLRCDAQPARVRGNESLLAQSLGNLVDNALKYRRSAEPPRIEIVGRASGSERGGTSYALSVRDNGVGMSPDEAEHAFEPFYRAKRVPEAPGTGLGLSIVKRAIEASGGHVRVASALDRGTTFYLDLAPAPRGAPGAG